MIKKILSKIQKKGGNWILWRLGREFRHPTIPILKEIIDSILKFKVRVKSILVKKEENYLYAVYDLDINAITFNFVQFLVDAEYETSKRGKEGFIVVFVPPSGNKMLIYEDYDKVVDQENRKWRFTNILIPLISLSKKCSGFYLLPNRKDINKFVERKEVFPDLYDGINLRSWDHIDFFRKLSHPGLFEGMKASKQALRHIETWKREKKIYQRIVTITLRNQLFDPVRNSNTESWGKFARYIIDLGYYPVIVPDTDTSFVIDPFLEGIECFTECAWNIELRMALYESSFLNFTAPTGPSHLLIYSSNCKYIMMNNGNTKSILNTSSTLQESNLKYGEGFKFAKNDQRLVYKPDSFENIVEEFEKFCKI